MDVTATTLSSALATNANPAAADTEAEPGSGPKWRMFGKDGFSFGDLIDIVNPLHHIPVVGTLYRKVTGDDISALPRVAGGTLFGGALGLAASLVSVASKVANGKDITETVVDRVAQAFGIKSEDQETQTAQLDEQPAAHASTPPQPANPELSPAAMQRLADTFGHTLSYENTYAHSATFNPYALQAHDRVWDRLSQATNAYRNAPVTAPILQIPNTAQNLEIDA